MVSNQGPRAQEPDRHRAELVPACTYILVASLIWAPLVFVITGLNPFRLFNSIEAVVATLMFFGGALIASATAVGGGIVFNPMLQLVFGISGFSALSLAIVVQCGGMTSGAYGWYRQGEFEQVDKRQLLAMALCACAASIFFSIVFVLAIDRVPSRPLLSSMKVASALVSFYVAKLLWDEIKPRRARPIGVEGIGDDEKARDFEQPRALTVDWRIYPWIAIGAWLNVTTAVGIGGLSFSHIMKYYGAPAKQAVAVGVMMQAVSVVTQTLIIFLFMLDYVLVPMVCLGVLIALIGGRLAPSIMTRSFIEPYVKHALALTALGMGMTSLIMLAIG